jgi:hypothetical protein
LPKEIFVRSKVLEIFRRGDEIVLRKPAKGFVILMTSPLMGNPALHPGEKLER